MFFQVDDDFWSNRKVIALIDEKGAEKAAPAFMLWTLAGSKSRKVGYDGVITLGEAKRIMENPALAKRAAGMLVSVDLWHAPGHDCEKCPPVEAGTWLFHTWFQFGYAKAAAEREGVARRKELRTPALVEAVWARDLGIDGVHRCRYCSTTVVRPQKGSHGGLRRGDEVGQLDHVDPTRAIGASNIVLACPECNKKKSQRTPEQAGMTLQPAPRGAVDQVPDQDGIKTGSRPPLSSPRGRPRGGVGGVGIGAGVKPLGGPTGLAGEAPEISVPAQFGSPWQGHHGPPPPADLIEQATCSDHDLPRPCRKCAAAGYAASSWPTDPDDLRPPPASPPPGRRRRGSRGGRKSKPRGES